MKTKALLLLLVACMLVTALVGCSSQPYNYDLSKYLKLGNYQDITIQESDIVSGIKDEYQTASKTDAKDTTYKSDTEGVDNILVEEGDTVNIDYEGKIDGVKFDGGTASGSDLTIGSGKFIDGFEDGLIDGKVGETIEVEATFHENYGKDELNGKTAIFTVKINSIKRTTYPEYNDENVKKYTDYETVAAFEEKTRETVVKNLLWEKLYEDSKVIKYPEKELKEYYNNYVDSYTSTAATLGVSIETYAKYMGYTKVSDFFAYLASYAQSQVKQELILYSMLEAVPILKLSNSSYEIKAYELWEKYCTENDYEGTYKTFQKQYDRETIEKTIYYDIIIEYIMANSEVDDDVTKNGLVETKKGIRYYIDNVMQTGWQLVDLDDDGMPDKCYFNTTTGYLAVGGAYAKPEDGGEDELFYEFTDKGIFVGIYNGFYTSGTNKLYYVDGVYQTGWQEIEGNKYYFFDNGYAAIGDVEVKNERGESILGRFTEEGVYEYELIGWITTDAGTRYYYKNDDGKVVYATREYKYEYKGKFYTLYFGGKDGYLASPLESDKVITDPKYGKVFVGIYEKLYIFYEVELDEKTVYAVLTDLSGIYNVEDDVYYFKDGVGQTGWQLIDGDMYFFSSEDGKKLTGEQKIKDVAYDFGTDGKLTTVLNGLVYDDANNLMYFENNVYKTGFVTVEENKYYFGEDGRALLGWIDVDGDGVNDYYSRNYIIVVSQTATIDGIVYVFDAEGNFTVSEDSKS